MHRRQENGGKVASQHAKTTCCVQLKSKVHNYSEYQLELNFGHKGKNFIHSAKVQLHLFSIQMRGIQIGTGRLHVQFNWVFSVWLKAYTFLPMSKDFTQNAGQT